MIFVIWLFISVHYRRRNPTPVVRVLSRKFSMPCLGWAPSQQEQHSLYNSISSSDFYCYWYFLTDMEKQKSLTSKILSIKCLHHDELLNKLCLEPSCIDSRLICSRCCKEKQPHHGHNIQTLKEALQEIQYTTSQKCMVDSLEKIEALKAAAFNTLNRVKQAILIHFDNTKQKLDQMFIENSKRMNLSFSNINSKVKDMHSLSNHNIINETHLRDLSKILGEFTVLHQHITSNLHEKVIGNAIQEFQKFINHIQMKMDQDFLPSQKLLSNESLEIAQLHTNKNALINWSDTLKGGRITIMGPRVERRADNNWLGGMVLSDVPLSMSIKTSWGLKISHYSFYCIYMGIALKSIVMKNNYNFQNRGNIGHGCYMVDTNGNTFSHTQKEFNNVYMMKEFNKNQSIVFISFDPLKNKLTFKLDGSTAQNSRIQLNIPPLPKGDFYYIAVFLRGVNNSVELITENIPPI